MTNDSSLSLMNNSSDANDNKFLGFRLGDEEYGVEILRVREIIGLIDITALPQTPEYVKGVINLRGKIIPVIELRTKFGLPSVDYTEATCVIVVDVRTDEAEDLFQMGVIVDTVSEVKDIPPANIEPAPRFGEGLNTDYILGMGKITVGESERVVILLDTDSVLTGSELQPLMDANRSASQAPGAERAAA